MTSALREHIEQIQLVDHHAHTLFSHEGDEARFLNLLNEGSAAPLPRPQMVYDSQVAFAIRRWCAELLDLEPHTPMPELWKRHAELGEEEVGRRFTKAAGVSDWLIDTGLQSDRNRDLPALQSVISGATHEIVRLEAVAEELMTTLDDPTSYPDTLRALLSRRRAEVVGAKTVLGYRTGLDQDLGRPTDDQVITAARRWRAAIDANDGAVRLTEPTLLSFGIHTAVDLRMPLQIHTGFGDNDETLSRNNPLHLTDFLRAHDQTGVPIFLLHCYPYEREAGYLASAFETVYFDIGMSINFLGAQSAALIARSFELAPFGKILYSSDAYGSAEMHYLGARLWRNGMASVLGQWVADGEWSEADAIRVVSMVARTNALHAYELN